MRDGATAELIGLRRPTNDFRDLGPPYVNSPGYGAGPACQGGQKAAASDP